MSNTQTALTQKLNIIATALSQLADISTRFVEPSFSFAIHQSIILFTHVLFIMLINLFHFYFLQLFIFQESSGDTSNPPWCGQYRGTLDRSSGGPGAGNIVMSEIKAGEKLSELE